MIARAPSVALSLALVTATTLSGAAPPSRDHDEAVRLFEEGKALVGARDFAKGCRALAQSDEIEPAIGTLGLLAACHEMLGKRALAYREYLQTAERAHKATDGRAEFARAQAGRLRASLPKILVHARGQEPGLTLVDNDAQLQLDEENVVEPGQHHLVARAAGYRPWETVIVAEGAQRYELTISSLVAVDADPPPASAPPSPAGLPRDHAKPGSSALRTAGWVLGGVGVAALIAGSVAGALVLHQNGIIDAHCDAEKRCDAGGLAAVDAARGLVWANALGWGLGALAVGTGLVFVVAGARQPSTAGTSGSIGVRGSF